MDSREPSTGRPIIRKFDQYAYKVLVAAVILLLGTATIVYRLVEDWSWIDSIYFSTVAITTVGFGDLTPSTDASKLFTVIYILSGIALVATYLSVTLRLLSHRVARPRR